MKTKKYIKQYMLMVFVAFFAVSCFDNIPSENELPRPPVDFTYKIIDENYQIDFYVYATVQFTSTSSLEGEAHWDFGDGNRAQGDVVTHNFQLAGLYEVTLTIAGQSRRHPIMINDIVPLLSIDMTRAPADSIFEVLNTPVSIIAVVPQPVPGMRAEYTWLFPAGTYRDGQPITTSTEANPFENHGITFNSVGSQQVRLQVRLFTENHPEGRDLTDGVINIPIAFNAPAPTLYFARRNANVQALKIPADPGGITINPFDMGVNSGRTPFNILYHNREVFLLDAGINFTWQNYASDATEGGDGRIRVMSADGTRVGTVLVNEGHAFNDPFFGYIRGTYLYYSNRNTGVLRVPLSARDRVTGYSTANAPWFFANDRTGWHGRGISFGAINSAFLQVGDVWWWGKSTFNASHGVFRFRDSDISDRWVAPNSPTVPAPASGAILSGVPIRALLWDATRGFMYFTTVGANSGIFRATLEDMETLTNVRLNAPGNPYRLLMENGENLTVITATGRGEGTPLLEVIGISQLALDEATGNVYFGFRSGNPNITSGLMRFNHSTGFVEHVLYGVEGITGVTINNTPSRLF